MSDHADTDLRRLAEHNDAVREDERERIAGLLREQAALHRDIANRVKARFGDANTGDETENAAADALEAFAAKLRADAPPAKPHATSHDSGTGSMTPAKPSAFEVCKHYYGEEGGYCYSADDVRWGRCPAHRSPRA